MDGPRYGKMFRDNEVARLRREEQARRAARRALLARLARRLRGAA